MTTHISRRSLISAALAAPVASSFTNLGEARAANRPKVQRIDFTSVAGRPRGVGPQAAARGFSTGRVQTDAFDMVALTWVGATTAVARIRTRSDGAWSTWRTLHADHHAAEAGTNEAGRARSGTDPAFAPKSDAIEVQLLTNTSPPDDLTIELINPGTVDSPGLRPQGDDEPKIHTRSDWGADESLRESGNPLYNEVRGAFVHHTAGANRYKKADVPSIIRGIYAYHVIGRGWRDIGYNFVVDKFGRIWEGRYGGTTKAVVGAHARSYNAHAFGASVLGTYTRNEPTQAALTAFAELIAWKFRLHEVDPTSVSYPELKDVPAIAGHRDGGATACPGEVLYDQLSIVRGGVARRLR